MAIGVTQKRPAQFVVGVAAAVGDDLKGGRLMHQHDRLAGCGHFAVQQPLVRRGGSCRKGRAATASRWAAGASGFTASSAGGGSVDGVCASTGLSDLDTEVIGLLVAYDDQVSYGLPFQLAAIDGEQRFTLHCPGGRLEFIGSRGS